MGYISEDVSLTLAMDAFISLPDKDTVCMVLEPSSTRTASSFERCTRFALIKKQKA